MSILSITGPEKINRISEESTARMHASWAMWTEVVSYQAVKLKAMPRRQRTTKTYCLFFFVDAAYLSPGLQDASVEQNTMVFRTSSITYHHSGVSQLNQILLHDICWLYL